MTETNLRTLKKYRRFTKKERERYIALWKNSGLSKSAFCRETGLVRSTFLSWLENKSIRRQETESNFIPLTCNLIETPILAEPEKQLKIHLSNGVMMEGGFKREELALWLKEVKNGFTTLC